MTSTPTDIQLDLDSLAFTGSGSVTGRIWIRLGSNTFPESGWSDFPVVLLTWWLGEMSRLHGQSSELAVLRFMDGPFSVHICPDSEHGHVATLMHGTLPAAPTERVDLKELYQQTRQSGMRLVDSCREHRWVTDDVTGLTQELAR